MMLLTGLRRLRGNGNVRRAEPAAASRNGNNNGGGAVRALVFDWGNTLMREFPQYTGPMAHWPRVRSMPGVRRALARVPGHLVCCVASGGEDSDATLVADALARVRIRHHFRHLFTRHELGASKPEPGFYLAVCQRLDLRPAQIVMVGDSLDRDIRPAKSVGMRTVWIARGKAAKVPAADEADAVIASMRELTRALARINR